MDNFTSQNHYLQFHKIFSIECHTVVVKIYFTVQYNGLREKSDNIVYQRISFDLTSLNKQQHQNSNNNEKRNNRKYEIVLRAKVADETLHQASRNVLFIQSVQSLSHSVSESVSTTATWQ